MRVARHQHILQRLGLLLQQVEKPRHFLHGLLQPRTGIELDVHRHLVVPRPSGMDLLADVPERCREPRLHLRMDVLALDGEPAFHGFLVQFFELRHELREFISPQQPHLGQHGNMRHRPQDVPRGEHQIQFPVLPDGECVDLRGVIESFVPDFHNGFQISRLRLRLRSK